MSFHRVVIGQIGLSGQPQVEQVTGLDALGESLLRQRQDGLVHRLVRNNERRGQHLQGSVKHNE